MTAFARVGQRIKQIGRIGVQRPGEEFAGLGHFDDLPRIHQGHTVRHARNDGEVVRDQHQRHVSLRLQFSQQRQDLGLGRHVECGGGFIGNHDVRVGRERNRNHHALLLPARHLEREIIDTSPGLGNAHAVQPFDGFRARGRASQPAVALNHLGDLPADCDDRVEAGRWFLKDDADPTAAHIAHAGLRQLRDIQAIDSHPTGADASTVGQQAQDRQRGHRLATA